jgi:two-component system sensor histidine kinase SenX3
MLVGFAAETHDVVAKARAKLSAKNVDLIVANDVSRSDAGFEVEVDVPPDTPAIRGDRTACLLLFDNLVDNAIRYSHAERSVSIRARATGPTVTITVTDRGDGIPADELTEVTRRFFRGRNAGSGGSGLGLAIASRIATDQGGSLHIDSAVGAGTTVSVTLPAADERDEEAHSRR